jgi:hypothetical protein
MLPTLLENNRRLSHLLYFLWNRHGTVLLGHPVVDATVAWLEPTDNRAHNRVVSTWATQVTRLGSCGTTIGSSQSSSSSRFAGGEVQAPGLSKNMNRSSTHEDTPDEKGTEPME